MADAYSMINQKLQNSLSEQENLEKTIQELKVLTYMTELSVLIIFVVGCADAYVFQAYLRRHERDYTFAQKEIVDLQKQVNVKSIIIYDD